LTFNLFAGIVVGIDTGDPQMATNKLIDPTCKNAKARAASYRLTDGQGLSLLVKPNGSKLWHLRFRHNGTEQILSLGIYPETTLADAREKRTKARKLIADGIHPGHYWKAEEQRQKDERKAKEAEVQDTVAVLVIDWLAYVRRQWKPERVARVEGFLNRHLLPAIGEIPLRNLTASDVRRALDSVVAQGKVNLARLLKGWLRAALHWAEERDRIAHDPTLKVKLPKHKHEHKTPLKPRDIAELWRALDGYRDETTVIGIKLLLLTFVRPTELREALWSEIDGATWRLPPERTKMSTPHIVPLSPEAQALLQRLRVLGRGSPYLFPSSRVTRPVSRTVWDKCLIEIQWQGRFSPHAARATASTGLRELGYSSDWIEVQLAHLKRNKVEASYNFAEYLPQRREMMARWSAYVVGLGEGTVEAISRKEQIAA
jgi:integrase